MQRVTENNTKYDMKKNNFFIALCAIALGFSACSSDDDEQPQQLFVSPTTIEAVDLGLPSGIKWCNMNVGAKDAQSYGEYFAWGDSTLRGDNWATDYKYNWVNAPFNNGQNTFNQTFFNKNKDRFCPEGTLASKYDAATQIYGDEWRMPTESEWQELYDNCTWEWTDNYNSNSNVAGYIVYKDNKDNHIFLPAAGKRNSGSLSEVGQGFYWSSTLPDSKKPWYASSMYFRKDFIKWDNPYQHYYGFQIRAVQDKNK